MTSFLSSAKRILSDKWVTLAIIVFSILGRIIQLIFFFNLRLDASHQVIATRNFLKGAGISMAKAYANDLSVVVYEPLINWPPGYSILLAPVYLLSKRQTAWTAIPSPAPKEPNFSAVFPRLLTFSMPTPINSAITCRISLT